MDTTDPDIQFDDAGVCNHCHQYDAKIARDVPPPPEARRRLESLVSSIKQRGRGREYDCVIGVSGGVDSSSVALLCHAHGLRPLAVHLDNGWDSELAVRNIEQIVTKLSIDLVTVVLDWDEFRDLQLAFLKASTPDSEIPSDHAIVSACFQVARLRGIPYVLSGCNARTESHLPCAWSRGHDDWRYIRSIHALYGTRPLATFPHRTLLRRRLDRRHVQWIDVLNLTDYTKAGAKLQLQEQLGWRSYSAKHFESIYTRFYQGHLLPTKFGFDKRRCHLSSLICAGELSRADGLAELGKPTYPPAEQVADRVYVRKKLGVDEDTWNAILAEPPRRFVDFPSYDNSRWLKAARGARALFRGQRKGRS